MSPFKWDVSKDVPGKGSVAEVWPSATAMTLVLPKKRLGEMFSMRS